MMAFARPLIHAAIDNSSGPADALERTNRVLLERRSSLFITAICASAGPLVGAPAAGQCRPRVAADRSARWLADRRRSTGSGPLLGAFPSLGLSESVADLVPGDMAVFYTDGVTDARSVTGERFEDAPAVRGDRGRTQGRRPMSSSRSAARSSRFQAGHAAGRRHHDRGHRPAGTCRQTPDRLGLLRNHDLV